MFVLSHWIKDVLHLSVMFWRLLDF
jgi:hypothetical protein